MQTLEHGLTPDAAAVVMSALEEMQPDTESDAIRVRDAMALLRQGTYFYQQEFFIIQRALMLSKNPNAPGVLARLQSRLLQQQ